MAGPAAFGVGGRPSVRRRHGGAAATRSGAASCRACFDIMEARSAVVAARAARRRARASPAPGGRGGSCARPVLRCSCASGCRCSSRWRCVRPTGRPPPGRRAIGDRAARRRVAQPATGDRARPARRTSIATLRAVVPVMPRTVPVGGRGFLALGLARRLRRRRTSTTQAVDAVLRGLPHNVTTEMDLALWALAQRGPRRPGVGRGRCGAGRPAELAEPLPRRRPARRCCRTGSPRSSPATATGRWPRSTSACRAGPRIPTHLLGVARQLPAARPTRPTHPDVRFARSARPRRRRWSPTSSRGSRRRSPVRARGSSGSRCGRARAAGRAARDAEGLPRAPARARPGPARGRRRRAGRAAACSTRRDDVFFLDLREVDAARDRRRPRPRVAARRRAEYERELRRRHVPRVLLSDGTEPEALAAPAPPADGALVGTPASAGHGHRRRPGGPRPGRRPARARRDPRRAVHRPRLDAAVPHRGRRW